MQDEAKKQDQTSPATPVSQGVRREYEVGSVATPLDQEGLPSVEIPKSLEQTITPVVQEPFLDTGAEAVQSIAPHPLEPKHIDISHLAPNTSKGPIALAKTWIARIVGREVRKGKLISQAA